MIIRLSQFAWLVLFLMGSLALASEAEAPSRVFTEAVLEAENRLLEDLDADPSQDERKSTQEFLAGALQHAWSLSSAARQLNHPRFLHNTELVGMPGLVNPDTHYSSALLEEGGIYVISGTRGAASHVTFQFIDAYPMIGLSRDLQVVDLDALNIAEGERFDLQFGGPKRQGHWWPLPDGARAVLVRQTFSDWHAGTLTSLNITRENADQPESELDGSRMTLAARYLAEIVELWAGSYLTGLRRLPLNQFPPLRPSADEDGGLSGQYGVMARFELSPEEALVVRARRSDARYQSIQVGDRWFVTPDYLSNLSSLNSSQAGVGSDDHYTFVVSHEDPGVENWVRAGRGSQGFIMIRWQGLNTPLSAQDQPTMKIVPMDSLRRSLPADVRWVSAGERAQQIADRHTVPVLKQ